MLMLFYVGDTGVLIYDALTMPLPNSFEHN
jgi:hypothetical protein